MPPMMILITAPLPTLDTFFLLWFYESSDTFEAGGLGSMGGFFLVTW